MKNITLKLIVFIGFSTLCGTTTSVQSLLSSFQTEVCNNSFEIFAYDSSNWDMEADQSLLQDWQIEAKIPLEVPSKEYYQGLDVSLARVYNGQEEVWITGQVYKEMRRELFIIIYYPHSSEWEFVTPNIGDTGFYATELFLDNNNAVWAKTAWERVQDRSVSLNAPILSKFDESKRRFEVARGVLEFSPPVENVLGEQSIYYASADMAKILLDENDIFWILIGNNGLYRYDPMQQVTERQDDLQDIFIGPTALSSEGNIYIWAGTNSTGYTARDFYTATIGELLEYIPQTGELVSLGMPGTPDEMWPRFSGLLVDQNGRLWLGSVGFLEDNGTWHLLHTNAEAFMADDANFPWITPRPILESSDGRIWFKLFKDQGGRGEGTAWYDPRSEQGCVITNMPVNIVEDSQQQLWLLVEGKLYKHTL